jgi:hypothetical protein
MKPFLGKDGIPSLIVVGHGVGDHAIHIENNGFNLHFYFRHWVISPRNLPNVSNWVIAK